MLEPSDVVTSTKHEGQVMNDYGGDVSIHYFCLTFQVQFLLNSILPMDKIGHLVHYLIQVPINLEIGTKLDLKQFNWSVGPTFDNAV